MSMDIGKEKIHINVARLKKGGENFEVVIHPEIAIQIRNDEKTDVTEALDNQHIFADAKKGQLASEELMQTIFNSNDALVIALEIIKKGEIQLTSEYREKLREQKRRSIVSIIHANAIDPTTKLPHPAQRIENAIAEAKVKIDENRSADEQIQDIMHKLKPILPIKFEQRELQIILPSTHASKAYSVLNKFGKLKKQEWQNDGSLLAIMEIPAGRAQDLIDQLNSQTSGEVDIKILNE